MKNIFKKFNYVNWPPSIRRFINICIGFHFFRDPYGKMKIIGVTGTNGKTTTTTLLHRIATQLGYKAGLIGTVENLIGEKKVLTDFTTPEAFELNKMLREMQKEGCEYVFMEVSSHGLEEKRVAGIKFSGGIFTNLTQDHLDYHKNMENYFLAKKKFFKMLPQKSFALTNIDNEYGSRMIEGIKAHKFSYGFPEDFDRVHFHGQIKRLDFEGLELLFNKIEIRSKLLGKFNAYNLLAVWSACSLLGFDMGKPARNAEGIASAGGVNKILENIEPPRGRFQHFTSTGGISVIVDYAHTPDALQNVLLTIGEIKPKDSRVISVFGCGGDRDSSKRSKMGRIGVALSDVPIFTSDNPRSEDPNKIIADMTAELYPEDMQKIKLIPDRREAIKEAVKLARKGDIILCAGKGHEDYQEIKGIKNHFDDMEELRKAFR